MTLNKALRGRQPIKCFSMENILNNSVSLTGSYSWVHVIYFNINNLHFKVDNKNLSENVMGWPTSNKDNSIHKFC